MSTYYDAHSAELRKANPQNSSLEALDPKIRDILSGERVNQNFEEWLEQIKRRIRIEYREAAFSTRGARSSEMTRPVRILRNIGIGLAGLLSSWESPPS